MEDNGQDAVEAERERLGKLADECYGIAGQCRTLADTIQGCSCIIGVIAVILGILGYLLLRLFSP